MLTVKCREEKEENEELEARNSVSLCQGIFYRLQSWRRPALPRLMHLPQCHIRCQNTVASPLPLPLFFPCCFSAIKLPEFSARTGWTDLALPGTGCLDGLLCLLVFCARYSLLCVCRWQWSSCRVECLCLCLVNLRVAAVAASAAVPGTCSQLLGLCCFHYRPHGRLLNAKCADSQSKNAKNARLTHCAPSSLL